MPVISEVKVCLHGHMKDPKLSSPKQMATNYLEIRIWGMMPLSVVSDDQLHSNKSDERFTRLLWRILELLRN